MVDQMVRRARTQQEAADMQAYIRLSREERTRDKPLTTNQKKQLNRVRLRCLKAGLIKPIGRKELESLAREVYNDMPFWKKWLLRARFHLSRSRLGKWLERWRAEREVKRIARAVHRHHPQNRAGRPHDDDARGLPRRGGDARDPDDP